MTDLLIKLFIKNSSDVKNASVRASYGTFAGAVGIVTNILIATAKLVIGIMASSLAVTADAANNLSDAGSSLITMIGFKLSGKPADREHPYGHARYEYVTGLIVSMIVVLLGGTFLIDSVKKIINPEESNFEWAMIIVLSISILVKLWQCFFYLKCGKKISSDSLRASAADSRNDCIMTGVVLIGAIVTKIWGLNIDGWLGAGVALFILIAGIKLIIDTANPLIGEAPDAELIGKIKGMMLSRDGIVGVHDLIIHSYGANRIFCSAHAEVPADSDMMECHDMMDNIEDEAYNQLGVFLVIHTDPVTVGNPVIDGMCEYLVSIVSDLPEKCTFHDFRVVFGPTHDNVLFDLVVPYTKVVSDDELIDIVSREFLKKYPKSVMKIKIDNDFSGVTEQ